MIAFIKFTPASLSFTILAKFRDFRKYCLELLALHVLWQVFHVLYPSPYISTRGPAQDSQPEREAPVSRTSCLKLGTLKEMYGVGPGFKNFSFYIEKYHLRVKNILKFVWVIMNALNHLRESLFKMATFYITSSFLQDLDNYSHILKSVKFVFNILKYDLF